MIKIFFKKIKDENANLSNAAWELTKSALSDELKISPEKLKFAVQKGGKPYLLSEGKSVLFFNISHTHGAVLLGISDEGEIGVDIENLIRRKTPFNIIKKYFHKKEIAYVGSAESDDIKAIRFYEIWTKKEAYLKQTGKGITVPLSEINTLSKKISDTIYTWQEDGYICSVCISNRNTVHKQIILSVENYVF